MSAPNVLFLMSDEHNHRFLSYRESVREPVQTPHLDDLATTGTTFEHAYTPFPVCAPARKCLLTGQRPMTCDAFGNASVFTGSERTLPATLADGGYETCLVGKMHFNGTHQFNGFKHRPYGDLTGHGVQQPSHQPDPIDPDRLERQPRRQSIDRGTRLPNAGVTEIPESLLQEQVVAREAVAWLREHRHRRGDQPWFLCASFSRPHFPLTAPRRHFERYWPNGPPEPAVGWGEDTLDHPYNQRQREHDLTDTFDEEVLHRARAGYFACVDFLDEVIGEFLGTLAAAGFLENTIVIYTSDHGEMAGEHGQWWKSTYHDGATRVPLSIQLPGQRHGDAAPVRIETPVSLIDLFPTICGLCEREAPAGVEGVDLAAAVRSGDEPDREPVMIDNLPTYRAIREGRYKYVAFRDDPELLFDLVDDPFEQDNLAPTATGEDAAALERLRTLREETLSFAAAEEAQAAARNAADRYRLPIPPGTGNAYLMPDGRLVDAATPLYKPDELALHPGDVFADWPGTGQRE